MHTYVGDMERRPESILYIETDIPPRMTCSEYRRARARAGRRTFIGRVRARRAVKSAA